MHDALRILVIVGMMTLSAAASAEQADAIWSGGPIVTVDDADPSAEAVAVRDGRIVAVGTRAEVEKLAGPRTRRIDLRGRTLVPGSKAAR